MKGTPIKHENLEVTTAEEHDAASSYPWSPMVRLAASAVIGMYVIVVVLGPLSNPVRSDHLSGPLAEMVAPIHQSLYLGHGYRFFGPDPGPSHLVFFKVKKANGELVQGHFPDRDTHWPRLLYHRWFMLSETLYNEHSFTPDREAFDVEQKSLAREIDRLRSAGSFELVKILEAERVERERSYRITRKRISEAVDALENQLIERYGGQSVQLYLRERAIPEPLDQRLHVALDDPRFLSPLLPIGTAAKKIPCRRWNRIPKRVDRKTKRRVIP